MTMPPREEATPGPVVDLSRDGAFHLPPSEDARRQTVAIGTIIAALLLHLIVVGALLYGWHPAAAPTARPIQVTLLREAPKPPLAPKPKPEAKKPAPKPVAKPKPAPKPKPKPKPQPVMMKPRESGPDQKTEAAKDDQPKKTELPKALPIVPKVEPAPKPPNPMPQPPAPKPKSPRVVAKAAARGHGVVVPIDRLPPALRPQRAAAPAIRNLVLRLPSHGGGNGTRDLAGDPYLNAVKTRLERNRIYPPADDFAGALARQAIFGVLISPSGTLVNIKLLAGTGIPKLDEAAREMITNSAPFPHLPADFPQVRTPITVLIPIYPAR